jgi:flagellar motor switch protein FliN/FliY
MRVSIEIGRIRLRIRDLTKLAPGTIVEVKKPAGEPFDVCINDLAVARGEVVSVEQSSGVRIVEVLKAGGLSA